MSQEMAVKSGVWRHLLATLESHKEGGGEGRGRLGVGGACAPRPAGGALHLAREHLKLRVFLGMFSGADQTHEGIERCPPPGTAPDSGIDHCPDRGRLLFWRRCLPPACPTTDHPGCDP